MSAKSQAVPPRRPWRVSTLAVIAFLVVTILPAYLVFALTPEDARVVSSVQAWNGCVYRVQRGDNLFRIGARYGVTYHYLTQLNDIANPNYVWAGQIISVPCGAVPPAPYNRPSFGPVYPPYQCPWCQPFAIPTTNCAASVTYVVQPGDNLFRIAVNNGSTIQWIRTQNNLWGKVLRPAVTLQVPCPGYVTYGANVFTPTPGGGIVTATPQLPTLVPPPTPGVDRIRMSGAQFRPQTRTVKVGSTVTWVNNEPPQGPSYDVTSGQPGAPTGLFSSGPIAPGGQFQFTFTTAGTYAYYSSTNPDTMTGEIIVTP